MLGNSSELSPVPSPSVSTVSVGSFGKASALSITPSPSVSVGATRAAKAERLE